MRRTGRMGQGGVAERVHQGGGAAAYEEIRMDVYRYPLTRQLDESSIFVTFFTCRMPGKLVYALGEITGSFTSDDLLGVIFGRFCIGK